MLKLIVNNDQLSYSNISQHLPSAKDNSKTASNTQRFLFDFQALSHNLYTFRAFDFNLHLNCEMTLEIKEGLTFSNHEIDADEYIVPIMNCDFPSIDVGEFNEIVSWDDYLQGMLMIQFQVRILEQLFLFCQDKNVEHVFIFFNKEDIDYVDIYGRFLITEEEIISSKGEQIKIEIPTSTLNYDHLLEFMDDLELNLRKALWRKQKSNRAIRHFFKQHYVFSL